MHLITAVLLAACSICGTWQGSLQNGQIRRVMEITQRGGAIRATIHSIDETDVPIVSKTVVVKGSTVTMTFDMNSAPWLGYQRQYVAKLNAMATSMVGPWSGPDVPSAPMKYAKVARATYLVMTPKITMVTVAPGVRDEVLDWGGSGRPVLLLAGLGNTGHDFYNIVPDLVKHYRVYSMTRRGFGSSDKPSATAANYSPDRLGDDVVAVVTSLHLVKPVLIGHSIAGEELSNVGARYPQMAAGLVYLDAGYWYALNDGTATPLAMGTPPPGRPAMPPWFFTIIRSAAAPNVPAPSGVPILAIFADPHASYETFKNADAKTQAIAADKTDVDTYVARWRRMVPSAKVITIPNADHFVYISNKEEVLRDINAFIAPLPK